MKIKRAPGGMKSRHGDFFQKKLLVSKHSDVVDPMQHKLCGFVEVALSPEEDPCLRLNSDCSDVCGECTACSLDFCDLGTGPKLLLSAQNDLSLKGCGSDCPEMLRAGSTGSDGQWEDNSITSQSSIHQLHNLSSHLGDKEFVPVSRVASKNSAERSLQSSTSVTVSKAHSCASNSGMSNASTFKKLEQLIGKGCWLSEERPEVRVYVSTGDSLGLAPLSSNQAGFENKAEVSSEGITSVGALEEGSSSTCSMAEVTCDRSLSAEHKSFCNSFVGPARPVSLATESPRTSSIGQKPSKRRCDEEQNQCPKKKYTETGSIVRQLHRLSAQNKVKVQGHVVRIIQKSNRIRVVTLLDVYLPSALWSVHNYWKPGIVAASSLSHLSCDWEYRKEVLQMASNWNAYDNFDDLRVWEVGECHVLGCKSHYGFSKSPDHDNFNLHEVFKCLPGYEKKVTASGTSIQPDSITTQVCGLQHLPDDILSSICSRLQPRDLNSIASVCCHTRFLARNIMPCMNLRLFPHQQAAVSWMLQRELNPLPLKNPIYKDLQTEDGFHLYLNCISGGLSSEIPPEVMDFQGGLFCDEPGLGKTVTALSLILKTQGKLSLPPPGVQVRWCERNRGEKLGYYELNSDMYSGSAGLSILKRCNALKAQERDMENNNTQSLEVISDDDVPLSHFCKNVEQSSSSMIGKRLLRDRFSNMNEKSSTKSNVSGCAQIFRSSRRVKRNLLHSYGEAESYVNDSAWDSLGQVSADNLAMKKKKDVSDEVMAQRHSACKIGYSSSSWVVDLKSTKKKSVKAEEKEEIWAQCDACKKWRKLPTEMTPPKDGLAWFCIMNKDIVHQSCSVPQEKWNKNECIQHLPGFRKKWMATGQEQNVAFFMSVLKDHAELLNLEAIKALNWLASLTSDRLAKMAYCGISVPPALRLVSISGEDDHHYDKIFHSFGLVQGLEENKVATWRYPDGLDELVFDSYALQIALSKPIKKVTYLYLSKATLIVVPVNLVEHWKNQILKHTKPGQLQIYVWNDQKRPPLAHSMAWDYDIVITTFPRLSAEWSIRKDSLLMHVHWFRIILDEGHTLGASMNLTNKLQMAISMHACFRWVLTGTPMPNTPNSQLAHLHPMLKFLHEEVYGKFPRWWEQGILRPFEACQEDGRARLLQLLQRTMISARKSDLHTIPPCVRKVKLLDFTVKHAASYNELVETVRRNILLADWNDPDHVESLLNPRQWKFRSSTLRNVRLSCCVAGHIKMRNAGEDIQETMDILIQQGVDPISYEFAAIKMALLDGGICNRCSEWCRLPILTPCRHLLCLSCVVMDCTKCTLPGCEHAYKMQNPKDSARPENPNPKWSVPQDLIELQPSYVQDDWHPEWHATSSSKVAYLVEQLKLVQGSYVQEQASSSDYNIEDHLYQKLVSESPITGTGVTCQVESQAWLHKGLSEKAIVFSQFLEHIHVVEKQLAEAGIHYVGMYSPMHSANKMKSLMTFKKDPLCTVLLMDGSAALGLDLSFVTRVYLMEPIWDRSMEEQVVSRAHRMGATRPVLVETLAMRGTIEEQMLEFLQTSHISEYS
ncbi:hypothetical protein O6H91_03G055700 [Diphasiastrum complanatum]|uniref:Uncharacterized protein n=1 Tax=Diphasiastrum complanatum TaxID=34168 RepID=A0ACC2E6D1_DIPCM|nr:hypothetical protein O6H91_03G055700 [Diphasiastrum complanatum]